MRTIGNILWFLFGGFFSGLAWVLTGLILCITIIGIPFGKQCFKFASMSFFPFGKDIVFGGGAVSLLLNIFWLIFFGIEMAICNFIFGLVWCVTIVGIPFLQNREARSDAFRSGNRFPVTVASFPVYGNPLS